VASAAIHFSISQQPRSDAQGSTLQQTEYARIRERSLIGELTLHRLRQACQRAREDGT
jgi:hypothetical protein